MQRSTFILNRLSSLYNKPPLSLFFLAFHPSVRPKPHQCIVPSHPTALFTFIFRRFIPLALRYEILTIITHTNTIRFVIRGVLIPKQKGINIYLLTNVTVMSTLNRSSSHTLQNAQADLKKKKKSLRLKHCKNISQVCFVGLLFKVAFYFEMLS